MVVFKLLICFHGEFRERKGKEEEDGVVERERDQRRNEKKMKGETPFWPKFRERREKVNNFSFVVQN